MQTNALATGYFPASLVTTESGGNWGALNDVTGAGGYEGHGGRLQFGTARLQDAANAGIIPPMTAQEFAQQPPEVQMAVENWHFQDIGNYIRSNGLDQAIGTNINGVPVTMDGMLAVAHLGGVGGLQRFIETGGQYNPADAFGTSLLDYLGTHGGSTAPQGGRGGNTPPAPYSPPTAAPQAPTNALADPALQARAQMAQRQAAFNALSESLRRPIYSNTLQGSPR